MRIVIVYATREGQTHKVADHIAATLRARAIDADVVDARAADPGFRLADYDAAFVAGSVHIGKHEKELVALVKHQRDALAALPCAFVSVSGSQATAEATSAPADVRARAAAEVQRVIAEFFAATGWTPARVQPVAGAMLFSKYNFLVRFMIRLIYKRSGSTLATTGDHEYTDWPALDAFVASFVAPLTSQPHATGQAHASG